MELTLSQLASMLKGKVAGRSDGDRLLAGTCALEAYIQDRVTFARNWEFGKVAAALENAVVLIPESMGEMAAIYPQNTYVLVRDVDRSMMDLQDFFHNNGVRRDRHISPTASISDFSEIGQGVRIEDNVHIGKGTIIGDGAELLAGAYIGDNVTIGRGTCISPLATCENCDIGDDTVIGSGCHVGVDGFRYYQDIENGKVRKMVHAGGVRIGSRVEIGANTIIQRSTFEGNPTVIGDDTKMGCTIVVGHNTKIGRRALITCHVMISGSNVIGDEVWIGASAVISNNVRVGHRARILINAVVVNDVPENAIVSGFYAMPHRQWKKAQEWILTQMGARPETGA